MANDKPWFPYVQCDENKRTAVMWGKGGWIFILAICGVLATSSLITYRVNAGEKADVVVKQNIKTLGANQVKMDEKQRIEASKTALMVKQLTAIANKAGIEHIEPPAVEESKLEKLK